MESYQRAVGYTPRFVPRPPGVTTGAEINILTGQIRVWEDNPTAFQKGFLAEELHHFAQLQEKRLLGRKLNQRQVAALERDVVRRMLRSGFKPYDPKEYAPYTDVPRPPGVAGPKKS